jgi:hypothetical protein
MYFMGPQGLYLNQWTMYFYLSRDVPLATPIWVRPHLPLHYWNPKSLEAICNKLRKYIYCAKRRDQYSCARICVEINLEEGLPKAIKLIVADWSYIQVLDYEKLPFKCRHCHGYGHFARHFKKKVEKEADSKGEQWIQVHKSDPSKHNNRSKGKEAPSGSGTHPSVQLQGEGSSTPPRAETTNNPFEILSTPKEPPLAPAVEEAKQQPISIVKDKSLEETTPLQVGSSG